MTIEIVDLPLENGDFHSYVCLPEGSKWDLVTMEKNNCLKNSVVMVESNLLMPVAVPCCPLSQVNHLWWRFEPHITKKCRGLSSDLDVKPNINGITKIRKNQL